MHPLAAASRSRLLETVPNVLYIELLTIRSVDDIALNMWLRKSKRKWASVKLGDTLGMLIWRETINGISCCFGGNMPTDK